MMPRCLIVFLILIFDSTWSESPPMPPRHNMPDLSDPSIWSESYSGMPEPADLTVCVSNKDCGGWFCTKVDGDGTDNNMGYLPHILLTYFNFYISTCILGCVENHALSNFFLDQERNCFVLPMKSARLLEWLGWALKWQAAGMILYWWQGEYTDF